MRVPLVILAIFVTAVSVQSMAKPAMPREKKDGVYVQKVGEGGSVLFYTVDTKSKLCFVSPGGGAALTPVDCAKLKNREEWRDIVNW